MYKFHKVSDEQFKKDFDNLDLGWWIAFSASGIMLPRRATMDSAGYDFFSPFTFSICPRSYITIPTGIKVELPTGTFLMIVPRSGLGFKYQLGLANTVGIIDADYYNNPTNEGHIMVKLVNNGNDICRIEKDQAFCQGIIMDYYITDDDNPYKEVRTGGLGSTDEQEGNK